MQQISILEQKKNKNGNLHSKSPLRGSGGCGLWFSSEYNTYPSLDFDFDFD